jgi:hypothetical protein
MNGLIESLMRRNKISRLQAQVLAARIVKEKSERSAEKKRQLESAQKTLDLDGTGVGEEPTHKREVTDPDINF